MKKTLLMLTALFAIGTTAFGEDYNKIAVIDGVNYYLRVYQAFEGSNRAYAKVIRGDQPYSGDIVIPSQVTYDGMTFPVTDVEEYAFYGCENLNSLSLPAVYTGVNSFAFCTNLKEISFDAMIDGIDQCGLYGCRSLKKITVKSYDEDDDPGFPPGSFYSSFLGVPLDCKLVIPAGTKSVFTNPIKGGAWLSFRNVEEQTFSGVTTTSVPGRSKYLTIRDGEVTSLEDGLRVTVFGVGGEFLLDEIISRGESVALPEGRVSIVRANGEAVKVRR